MTIPKEIKYIGFYDFLESKYMRVGAISSANKMDYICNSINKAGFGVHIVSPSWFTDRAHEAGYHQARTVKVNNDKKVTFCPSYGTSNKITRGIKIFLSLTWLFFWLLLHCKRNEKIIVYHSPWLSIPILWAKRIKGFQLILEVEELYGKVWEIKNSLQRWEKKLVACADHYIAVSDVLAEMLGPKTKIILYGNYDISTPSIPAMRNGRINIIYAGVIDYIKGGAFNAIKCASYLPENYTIHFTGPGGPHQVIKLKDEIDEMNNSLGRQACIYHGVVPEYELSALLHTCQVAINPQFDGENMNALFPSKILKYLSHNLRVVTTRIKSIDKSQVAPLLTFSKNDTPRSNAEAILGLDLEAPYNSIETIKKLDQQFVSDLQSLLT